MISDTFLNRIREQINDDEKYELYRQSLDKEPYRALRINTLKGSFELFERVNPWGREAFEPVEWCKEGLYIANSTDKEGTGSCGRHPYHQAGVYYIQEPSAMMPVTKLDIRSGMRVLDLCAAPGGKSTQIAAALNNTGLLVSNEPNAQRSGILSENVERMGIANGLVICHNPEDISSRFAGYFDRILVDAPCSGEGMFRKNDNAAGEWSEENVIMCSERQKLILAEAVKMLRPNGRIVYSTCTFAPAEDEEMAEWLVKQYPAFRLTEHKKLWPFDIKGEGHYYAVFDRGDVSKNSDRTEPAQDLKKHKSIGNIKEYIEFEKEYLTVSVNELMPFAGTGTYTFFGDELYLLPPDFPSMDRMKVMRAGLHLGTMKKNRFEPSYALAHFIKPDMARNSISLSEKEADAYLHGETLRGETADSKQKGWCLLEIDGYTLAWGKIAGGMIKNHYPKGLRNMY